MIAGGPRLPVAAQLRRVRIAGKFALQDHQVRLRLRQMIDPQELAHAFAAQPAARMPAASIEKILFMRSPSIS